MRVIDGDGRKVMPLAQHPVEQIGAIRPVGVDQAVVVVDLDRMHKGQRPPVGLGQPVPLRMRDRHERPGVDRPLTRLKDFDDYAGLEVRIELDNDQWRLSVLDSGGGIDDEHLAKVFDPFFTTKPVGEGLGLGLAISYGIVHEAGGQLQAENLPGGARLSLTLPRDLEPVC